MLVRNQTQFFSPQQTFTFSKLTAEALEKLLKHVQSKQERYQTSLRLRLYIFIVRFEYVLHLFLLMFPFLV